MYREIMSKMVQVRNVLDELHAALQVPLVTADGRLSRASGLRCPVDLLH